MGLMFYVFIEIIYSFIMEIVVHPNQCQIRNLFSRVLFFPLSLSLNLAQAAPGDLDISFDTDGIVTTAIGSDNDEGCSLAVQPDGKILLGHSFNVSLVSDSLIFLKNT